MNPFDRPIREAMDNLPADARQHFASLPSRLYGNARARLRDRLTNTATMPEDTPAVVRAPYTAAEWLALTAAARIHHAAPGLAYRVLATL